MGRKKLDTNYFEDTYSWNIRLRKEVLKKFLEAFHKEKSRRAGKGKGYFINGVVSELMLRYVEAVAAKEEAELVGDKGADSASTSTNN